MKIILTIIAFLFVSNLHAQSTTSKNCEHPRRAIKPYATVEEAALASEAPSRYITPLTEWKQSEKDGNITFTASYIYPAAWLNRQLLVCVESASQGYTIAVNGSEVGSTTNGATPAEFNVTKRSKQGSNELQITISKQNPLAELLQVGAPALGKVTLISQPTIRVRDIESSTRLNDSGDAIAEFNIIVKTDALNTKSARIHYELFAPEGSSLAQGYKDMSLEMRGEDTVSFASIVPAKWLWSIHNPTLLRLVVRNQVEGRYAETIATPIGLREVKYGEKRLSVNGKSTALRATTVAETITPSEIVDLKIQGYNTLMTKAGTPAEAFYALCDSVGVYVIPQAAINTSHGANHIKKGGNASNNPLWKPYYLARTAEMYHTTKSHPSVIGFSLGEGSTNGINLYESYLMLKALEPNRPIIYIGAGTEWNNDIVEGSTMPTTKK